MKIWNLLLGKIRFLVVYLEFLIIIFKLFDFLISSDNFDFSFSNRKYYPACFTTSFGKVSWSKVSFEMSKSIEDIFQFPSDKQCKERWLNHLDPKLKRYYNFFIKIRCFTIFGVIKIKKKFKNSILEGLFGLWMKISFY